MQASQEKDPDYIFFLLFVLTMSAHFIVFFIHLDVKKNGVYFHLMRRKEMELAYVFDFFQLMSIVVHVFAL